MEIERRESVYFVVNDVWLSRWIVFYRRYVKLSWLALLDRTSRGLAFLLDVSIPQIAIVFFRISDVHSNSGP